MLNMIKAEYLKSRHTFAALLPVIAPVLTLMLVLLLMGGGGNLLPAGAWNWWYTLLLPGMLAMICVLGMKKDKKMDYFNLLVLPVPMGRCMAGRIIYCSMRLLWANLIMFMGAWVGGALFGSTISAAEGFCGFLLLSIVFLWEIPLYLLLSARFGMSAALFSSMALSLGGVVGADGSFWWVCPSAVPARLMCPVLGILPNGLLVPAESGLWNGNVILPGVLVSLAWFVIMSGIAVAWFDRRAVKG